MICYPPSPRKWRGNDSRDIRLRFDTSLQTAATLAETVVELMAIPSRRPKRNTGVSLAAIPALVKGNGTFAAAAAVEYYNDLRAT